MKRISFFLSISLIFQFCTKIDESIPKELNYQQIEYYSNLKPEFKDFGVIAGKFVDGMLQCGVDEFIVRADIVKSKLTKNSGITFEQITELYSSTFGIDKQIVENYFNFIKSQPELLTLKNKKSLNDGVLYYAFNSKNEINKKNNSRLEERGVFGFIANLMGAHCIIQMAAGVVDVAIDGALTVMGGSVVGVILTVADYGNLLVTSRECMNNS